MPIKTKQKKVSKSNFVNKFFLKPSNPAQGMLLFAVVFATIGASYGAYKSFAATPTYTFTSTNLDTTNSVYATIINEPTGTLHNPQVVRLNPPADTGWAAIGAFRNPAKPLTLAKGTFKICANILKAQSTDVRLWMYADNPRTNKITKMAYPQTYIPNAKTTVYVKTCGIQTTAIDWSNVGVAVQTAYPGNLRVDSVSITRQ